MHIYYNWSVVTQEVMTREYRTKGIDVEEPSLSIRGRISFDESSA
jgi:hypothetical protein